MDRIEIPKSEEVGERVKAHRELFYKIFYYRYRELLPSLIMYKTNLDNDYINFYKLEYYLRNGENVVLGFDYYDKLKILGLTNSNYSYVDNPILTKKDIIFFQDVAPADNYKEITYYDNCKSGNFIVLQNKRNNYIPDFSIVSFYTDQLAEISLSRYSVIMQAKINTILKGDIGNETITSIANDMYNGIPYIKTGLEFDPTEQIITIDNNVTEVLANLKKEFNNKLTELNNVIGINTTFTDKESGVTNLELSSNQGYTSANSNVYLSSREEALQKIYIASGIKIVPYFNNSVRAELMESRENEDS